MSTAPAKPADRFAAALAVEAERYGAPPPLTLDPAGALSGALVVGSQRPRLAKALPELAAELERCAVLADAADPRTTAGWSVARLRTPLFAGPTGDKLATEILPGDPPIRWLKLEPVGGRRLVQTVAGTLAWAPLGHNRALSAEQDRQRLADFLAGPLAPRGSSPPAEPAAIAALLGEARDWARHAIPYILGGADPSRGIDCSALTQRLFQRHFGFWLPRHSSDQKRCGRRIGRRALQAGDLVFATARARRIFHVGLAVGPVGGAAGRVVHACLTEERVVEESLDSFFQRYTFRAATRLVTSPDTAETATDSHAGESHAGDNHAGEIHE